LELLVLIEYVERTEVFSLENLALQYFGILIMHLVGKCG